MKSARRQRIPYVQTASPFFVLGSLTLLFFILSFLHVAATTSVEYVYKTSTPAQVLGDSDEKESEDEDDEKDDQQEENDEDEEEIENEDDDREEAQERERTTQRINLQRKESEIETSDGLKIKTKLEDDGRQKLEIEQKKFKVKVETLSYEDEFEDDEDEVEDEESEDDDVLKMATDSGRPSLTRRNIKATSRFPLSIDPVTNSLMVTTPQGTKIVTVLPDQAVENLLQVGLISTPSAGLSPVSSEIELTEEDGKAVYVVQAKKQFRLFGLIPLETPTTITVSAEDGQVVSQERSLLTDVIDFLSP